MGNSPAVMANDTYVAINAVNLMADMSQVAININQGEADVSTFGTNGWREYLPKLSDMTIDYTGFFNKTANKSSAVFFAMFGSPGSATSWEVDFPSSAVGGIRYTGNGWARSRKEDGAIDNPVKATASIRATGVPSRSSIVS